MRSVPICKEPEMRIRISENTPEPEARFPRIRLSLRFKHEEFCGELYTRRKTLSLTNFVGSQAAFLTAG